MGVKLIAQAAPFSIDALAERRFLVKVIGKMNDGPVGLEAWCLCMSRECDALAQYDQRGKGQV